MDSQALVAGERPVLVGGTGRSGSTIVGHVLDHHRELVLTRPMEVRFLAGRFGLADALHVSQSDAASGQQAAELAATRIRERWFRRAPDVGLHTSIELSELDGLLAGYVTDFAGDPIAATRLLARAIMLRVAGPGTRWVDTTPANARQADRLEWIYPHARIVSVVRDGRDAAASFVQQSFGPDDVFAALAQWERRMLRIHQATLAARPGSVLQIALMNLVVHQRESTLRHLCEFLELTEDPAMRSWFDLHVSAANAHPGRWRTQFDEATVRRIDRTYAEIVVRLRGSGVSVPDE